jgi:hypothetical protein
MLRHSFNLLHNSTKPARDIDQVLVCIPFGALLRTAANGTNPFCTSAAHDKKLSVPHCVQSPQGFLVQAHESFPASSQSLPFELHGIFHQALAILSETSN